MQLSDAAEFLATHHKAVLITLDEDDVPHSSNVFAAFDGERLRVSLTDDRVKTGNLRRRPVAVVHLSSDDFWRWVAVECHAELSEVAAEAGDPVTEELLEVYESLQGTHDDPDDFRRAMVEDHRLVLRLTPRRVHGQLG